MRVYYSTLPRFNNILILQFNKVAVKMAVSYIVVNHWHVYLGQLLRVRLSDCLFALIDSINVIRKRFFHCFTSGSESWRDGMSWDWRRGKTSRTLFCGGIQTPPKENHGSKRAQRITFLHWEKRESQSNIPVTNIKINWSNRFHQFFYRISRSTPVKRAGKGRLIESRAELKNTFGIYSICWRPTLMHSGVEPTQDCEQTRSRDRDLVWRGSSISFFVFFAQMPSLHALITIIIIIIMIYPS